jgi:hypothetical protein
MLLGAVLIGAPSSASADVPEMPTIEGPITGPGAMHPGIRVGPAGTNPSDFDYIAEEYFVSGFAGPTRDAYKVRLLIRRPAHKGRGAGYSGPVIYEPTHSSGNALIFQYVRYGAMIHGYIGATVSATATVVNGGGPGPSLKDFNPERYGTLTINNNQTNEILAQVASLLRSKEPSNPLNPKGPITLIMSGTSASSATTRGYMANGNSVFRDKNGAPLVQGFFVTTTLGTSPVEITDVPTIQMPSQSELTNSNAWRRPDSDTPDNRFRIYEIPGMSHLDVRDNPPELYVACGQPLSRFPYDPVTFMGLEWVIKWTRGETPPHGTPVEVNAGPPRSLVLDEVGNLKGGIRTPHLDAPMFRYVMPNTGPGCNLTARQEALSDEVVIELYPKAKDYRKKFLDSLKAQTKAGFWPKEYTDLYAKKDMHEGVARLKALGN